MSHTTTDRAGLTRAESRQLPGLAVRLGLAMLAVVAGLVPFLLLWDLVADKWGPLARIDAYVAETLNAAVSGRPAVVDALSAVTDLGGTPTAVIVMTGATVVLALRRRWRPAMFIAVTGVGLLILIPLTKALVDRARPVVEAAVVAAPENASFPSGHSMASLVVWVSLFIVARPHLPRRAHPWLMAGVAAIVVAVGFTRLALGVHFVSDVLAGWLTGAAWVAATATAFWTWERDADLTDPLAAKDGDAAAEVAASRPGDAEAPVHRAWLGRLAAAATVLCAAFVAAGFAVMAAGSRTVTNPFDQWALELLAHPRIEKLLTFAELVGMLGSSTAVTAMGLALAVLASTLPHPGRAMSFVAFAVLGEVLLYFAVSRLVGRTRPELGEMAPGLPAEASWPSGHVTAAVVVYGAFAVLVALNRDRWVKWPVALVPLVIAPLVAWSRVYTGEHYPSDVLAGLLLGGLWLLACTVFVLQPARQHHDPQELPTRKATHAH